MRRALTLFVIFLVLGTLLPAVAEGRFGAWSHNPTNSVATDTLAPPGPPTTTHSDPLAGTVALSWAPSETGYVTEYQIQRADAPTGPYYSLGAATEPSFTDHTAAYNEQYYYRTLATYQNWTATSGTGMALSLAPTWGQDTTPLLSNPTLNEAERSALSVADGNRYTTRSTWPLLTYADYLELQTNPVIIPEAAVTSVSVTLVYQMNVYVPTSMFRLQISGNGGGDWTSYSLPRPGSSGTDIQVTVDVTDVINTPAAVENMRIRFQATSNISLVTGLVFQTSHDLVHVDVN